MRYVLKRVDGGVSIMETVKDSVDARTEIEKWTPKSRKEIVSVREMGPDEVIEDRMFRDAWTDSGRLSVEMPKARNIWREKMREARAPILEKLDIEYQRADEAGDAEAKIRIASKKQALRDVTEDPRIESAKTPEELKAVWPEFLR